VRSGFETQDLPVFVRMVDKDSHWSINNGLRSMVTTLLAMNMAGYSIVLPDMIGGNGYGSDVITPELFIRWLQATTFMPSLQFSYVPWQFDDPQVSVV
jgi:alpha-glucosidase (family GH31 glycosyl hydrolase)